MLKPLCRQLEKGFECLACAHHCHLSEERSGICGRRHVVHGELQIPQNVVCSLALDPYEKKPLFHFHPGHTVLSFGNLGCNFKCAFCQNWEISQVGKDDDAHGHEERVTPEQIVAQAVAHRSCGIAATYNEPFISAEWVAEVLTCGQDAGQPGVLVTNGFASSESLALLLPCVDAVNIDLKCFTENGYHWLGGRLDVVLDNIKAFHKAGKWMELTTLVVPGFNDSQEELTKIAEFIASLDVSIPWHVSAYHADYKMSDGARYTPLSSLLTAVEAGQASGLHYVYTGNVGTNGDNENTLCPHCACHVIERNGFRILNNRLEDGKCPNCGTAIPVVC